MLLKCIEWFWQQSIAFLLQIEFVQKPVRYVLTAKCLILLEEDEFWLLSKQPTQNTTSLQILKLLRGEKDAEELFDSHASDTKDSGYQNDDEESFPECCQMDRLRFEILEADDGSISISPSCTTSPSRAEKTHRLKLKDFLSQPLDWSVFLYHKSKQIL